MPAYLNIFYRPGLIKMSLKKKDKAKAISAELLELSLKNKLEETGKTR